MTECWYVYYTDFTFRCCWFSLFTFLVCLFVLRLWLRHWSLSDIDQFGFDTSLSVWCCCHTCWWCQNVVSSLKVFMTTGKRKLGWHHHRVIAAGNRFVRVQISGYGPEIDDSWFWEPDGSTGPRDQQENCTLFLRLLDTCGVSSLESESGGSARAASQLLRHCRWHKRLINKHCVTRVFIHTSGFFIPIFIFYILYYFILLLYYLFLLFPNFP